MWKLRSFHCGGKRGLASYSLGILDFGCQSEVGHYRSDLTTGFSLNQTVLCVCVCMCACVCVCVYMYVCGMCVRMCGTCVYVEGIKFNIHVHV